VKPVEEVIDVVGDFGPIPKQEESRFVGDESFGMSFDVSAIQDSQIQDQSLMMPPQIGKTKY
jgi:hypothetical protein